MHRLWIPGWASDAQIWSALPLSQQAHTIILNHHAADFTTYCQHYWQQTNTIQPVQVVAWSYGALVALQWLQQYPQLIHQVILLNSTPCFVAQADWPGIKIHTLTDLHRRLSTDPIQTVKAFWWMLAQRESQPRYCLAQLQRYRLDNAGLMQALQWMIQLDLRSISQRYAPRCHWIMGIRDPLLPNALHDQLPGQVSVLETGHCPMLSQPEQLWATLEAIE